MVFVVRTVTIELVVNVDVILEEVFLLMGIVRKHAWVRVLLQRWIQAD